MACSNHELGRRLTGAITRLADGMGDVRIMEVCGTHTMAAGRFGIRQALPGNVTLTSGPGCPVCVTPAEYIDNAVRLADAQDMTIATFGDMVRVPGNATSLEDARAEGVRVQVVMNPMDVLAIPGQVLFLAVGFETTAAPIAAAARRALAERRGTVFFYTSLKAVPPTLRILRDDAHIDIDAFLLPGHVSSVIGSEAYAGLEMPACIAGFEMLDILGAIVHLLEIKRSGKTALLNAYPQAVSPAGSAGARSLMAETYAPCDQAWRGLGALPGCSLRLKPAYHDLDAEHVFALAPLTATRMPAGCACGDVLRGVLPPQKCPLFGDACTPDDPKGPCMVSSEGACAAHFKYDRHVSPGAPL